MSLKIHRFVQIVGIVVAAVALASPALVHAEPHGGGDGHGGVHAQAHFGGARGGVRGGIRGGDHYFARGGVGGRAYLGRGFAGGHYAYRGWYGARWGYHPYWGGGWWGGYYWPQVYYGWNFPWFLAALPLGVATYWWAGVPYYYVNNVYYVWSPADDGYIVANPPPVEGDTGDQGSWYSDPPATSNGAPNGAPPPASAPPTNSSGPDDVYMYPEHGQSAQQQSTDRYQCHTWAQQQSGFDPTQPASQSSGNGSDYHRALIACLKGRGYSVD